VNQTKPGPTAGLGVLQFVELPDQLVCTGHRLDPAVAVKNRHPGMIETGYRATGHGHNRIQSLFKTLGTVDRLRGLGDGHSDNGRLVLHGPTPSSCSETDEALKATRNG
jgi:hypothetical protein